MNHSKRLGRGLGSGKGKTGGRGTKGQKARGKVPLAFAGSNLPLYKKLPLRRGLGNRKVSGKLVLVSLDQLSVFKSGAKVNLESLVEQKVISEKEARVGVKVLSKGEIKLKLEVLVPTSASARKKIEQAGGQVNA